MTDDHVIRNRAAWDRFAEEFVEPGRKAWASDEPSWGTWGVPEADVGMLEDVEGLDAIELGCGTGYVSAWLARHRARPIGLDNSPVQLATARLFQAAFDLRFPLIHGDAEHTPFPDASFDYAISEYGAAIWCDPYVWIPEAARILRPGGRLAFLGNSYLCAICSPLDEDAPVDERLHRDHFGLHRFDWNDDQSTEFHLPHGEWIRLLRSNGFEIEGLVELQAPEDSATTFPWVTHAWAAGGPTRRSGKPGNVRTGELGSREIRFLVRTLVLLLANAVGLFVANLVLDGMSVTASAFVVDVVTFTVVVGLMTPFMANQFRRRSRPRLAASR